MSDDPNSLYTFCIAGIATNVPTNNITNSNENCTMFGTNIDLIFLFNAFVSSRYVTACSNDCVNEPDSSPTFTMFIYIYGNTSE